MKQKTLRYKSGRPQSTALPFIDKPQKNFTKDLESHQLNFALKSSNSSSFSSSLKCNDPDFSSLLNDVLARIAASFSFHNLQTVSLVCRAWRDALRLLREALLFLKWGKRFKHGHGGVKHNLKKALDSFLEGAARGSTMANSNGGRWVDLLGNGKKRTGYCLV